MGSFYQTFGKQPSPKIVKVMSKLLSIVTFNKNNLLEKVLYTNIHPYTDLYHSIGYPNSREAIHEPNVNFKGTVHPKLNKKSLLFVQM